MADASPDAGSQGPSGDPVRVLRGIGRLVTCADGEDREGPAGIPDAALVWAGDEFLWAGPASELPAEYRDRQAWGAGGRLVVPGLVDCHTHLAFGGWRADEFEARIRGRSYLEIAESGGGIQSTVRATRELSEDELVERSLAFVRGMVRRGVTTVEAKSGYGLTTEDELKQLRAYQRLRGRAPVTLVSTLLGAHVVPPEYRDRREDYVDLVVEEMIPRVAEEGLATACDVFVEAGAFSIEEGRRILEAGREHGLAPRIHADQLGDGGGAALAAEVGALSADHLEHVSQEGIDALADAGVVAVSLPLASLYLDAPYMPARQCLDRGVPVAVSTDFNPGTAPSYDLPLALLLACVRQRLTPVEALRAATVHAAAACGASARVGSIEPGSRADFAVMDAPSLRHWMYHFRGDACLATVAGGRLAWRDSVLPGDVSLPEGDPSAWPRANSASAPGSRESAS